MDILKRPMFFAALICCTAAAISLFVKSLAFAIIVASLILVSIVITNKRYNYITVLIAIVLFSISLFLQFSKIEQINIHDGEKIRGSFLVTEETTDHGEFKSVVLKEVGCSSIPNGVSILVFDYKKTELQMGEILNTTLKLSAIDYYDEYRLSNYSNAIYATASVAELKKTGDYNSFYKTAGNIRKYVKETVTSHFSGDTAGLLVALTTGDKTLLSEKFLGNVKTTGISHVIVVSGMHLSIIMAAVFWCLDRMFYNKYIRCLLSVAVVVLIAAVCGFTMSILRAGVMFAIAGLAPIFNRENDSLSSLLTAVTAVLIGMPFAVFNISFQLSVLSTLALIWVVPFYYNLVVKRFDISSKISKTFIGTVLCSIFAILFTLPVTITVFGYVSIVAPVTNLIISYPIMSALILNIVALIIWAIPIVKLLAYPLFWIAGFCSRLIVFIVNLIAKLPITVAVMPKSAFWWSLLLLAVVIGYMYFYEYKKKRCDFNANSV